jgi:transcription initiation factor TFIIB
MSGRQSRPAKWDLHDHLKIDHQCPDCGGRDIEDDFTEGTFVCTDCGRVLQDHCVDPGQEWRTFSGENDDHKPDPSRVGMGYNPYLKGEQLSTRIDGSSSKAATDLARTQQKTSVEILNAKLSKAFEKIEAYCAEDQVPKLIVDGAKAVLSEAKQAGLGGAMDAAWCLACIYIGSKRAGSQIDKRRVSKMGGGIKVKVWSKHVFELNKFALEAGQEKINKLVDEGKSEEHAQAIVAETKGGSGRVNPKSLLPAHCQAIKIPVWTETVAASICDAIDDILVLGGRGANNIATTAIFIATHVVGNPRMFDEIYPLSGLKKSMSHSLYNLTNTN